jgi:hypothetical protein
MADLLTNWGSFFANHTLVRVCILFAHVGALVLGAGTAITADRAILRRGRDAAARPVLLETIASSHTLIIAALGTLIVSGLLLFAADADTYLHSRVFWTKMTLVAAVLTNGAVLRSAEQHAARGDERGWRTLRRTAVASITLWSLTAFLGVSLSNIG